MLRRLELQCAPLFARFQTWNMLTAPKLSFIHVLIKENVYIVDSNLYFYFLYKLISSFNVFLFYPYFDIALGFIIKMCFITICATDFIHNVVLFALICTLW